MKLRKAHIPHPTPPISSCPCVILPSHSFFIWLRTGCFTVHPCSFRKQYFEEGTPTT